MWLSHLSPLVTIVAGAHCCVHIINDKTKDYCRRWNWVVPHLFGSCNSFAQLLRSYIVIDTCDIISSKLLRTIVKFHIMFIDPRTGQDSMATRHKIQLTQEVWSSLIHVLLLRFRFFSFYEVENYSTKHHVHRKRSYSHQQNYPVTHFPLLLMR